MTTPFRPVFTRPGGGAYPLPDLTVQGSGPYNPLAAAVVTPGLPPELQAVARAIAAARAAQNAQDFPRALPAGAVGSVGSALTDLASLKAPFLPPVFPGVQARGHAMTQTLMDHLNHWFGASPGSAGTDAGESLGGAATALALPELLHGTPAEEPATPPLRPVVGVQDLTAADVAPVRGSVATFADLRTQPDGLYHVAGQGVEPDALVVKQGRTLTQLRASVTPTASGYSATTIPLEREGPTATYHFPLRGQSTR